MYSVNKIILFVSGNGQMVKWEKLEKEVDANDTISQRVSSWGQ
jgi:hypothetical protein